MSKLVIVESPNKISKIKAILGNDYIVKASFGHIMDVDPAKLKEIINNNFEPIYISNPDKAGVISELKKAAKGVTEVYIATDKDREGEMIGWNISKLLGLKDPKRITFGSITKTELLKAVNNPTKLNVPMVEAQKTRRLLDMIVGFGLTNILRRGAGKRFPSIASAGRVQSVVVRLIAEKEDEIKKHLTEVSECNFNVTGTFGNLTAGMYTIEKYEDSEAILKGKATKINDEIIMTNLLKLLQQSIFTVSNVYDVEGTSSPSPPFTTSTLQQESNKVLKMSVQKTMMAAQHLYEKGYITYMRTDSICICDEALQEIGNFIKETYGGKYHKYTKYVAKTQNTQEAHEAIRPTHIDVTELTASPADKIENDELRLYSLIHKRTLASQMAKSEHVIKTCQITMDNDTQHYFSTSTKKITFLGYLIVYKAEKEDEQKIPPTGTIVKYSKITANQCYKNPPPRYNEADLVKKLDPEKGLNIGRPSTYATIISKIKEREYVTVTDVAGVTKESVNLEIKPSITEVIRKVEKVNVGEEKYKFVPTEKGIVVTKYLLDKFPNIMDYKFTAGMEDDLDKIAGGEHTKKEVLGNFYHKEFLPKVLTLEASFKTEPKIDPKKLPPEIVLGVEPETGHTIGTRSAKFGPVIVVVDENGNELKIKKLYPPFLVDNVSLEQAIEILSYPKLLGMHEEKEIFVKMGEHGKYYECGTVRKSIGTSEISLEAAVDALFTENIPKTTSIVDFDSPNNLYSIVDGKFSLYIKHKDKKTGAINNVPIYGLQKSMKDEFVKQMTLTKVQGIVRDNLKIKKDKDKGKDAENAVGITKATGIKKVVGIKKVGVRKAMYKKNYS